MIRRLQEKIVFSAKLFRVKDVTLQNSVGNKAVYQIIEKRDTSLIVPLDENNHVLFVKEYFAAIDEYQYGLPKGRIDEGLDAIETANKELQEEIGYRAKNIDHLGVLTITPGYINQKTHIFLATKLEVSVMLGDELEKPEVKKHPLKSFEDLISQGKLTEARMIAALFLARNYLKKS